MRKSKIQNLNKHKTMGHRWGASRKNKKQMRRFAQERFNYEALFAQKWLKKSLIEGGTDIRGARAADVRSSFNE